MAEIKKRKPKLNTKLFKVLNWTKTKEFLLSNGLMTEDDFHDLDYTLYKDIDFTGCQLSIVKVEDKIEMWAAADRANNKFVRAILSTWPMDLIQDDVILFVDNE